MHSVYALLVSNIILAALIAVFALVITRLWRNLQFAHALWLLVLVKLVTPPLIQVPLPDFNFGSDQHTANATRDSTRPRQFAGTAVTGPPTVPERIFAEPTSSSLNAYNVARATQVSQPSMSASILWSFFLSHWPACLLILSGLGTLILSGIGLRRHQRMRRLFMTTKMPNTTLIDDAQRVSQQIGLASCPPVRITDALVCPLVSMGWKQLVLLPSHLLAELDRDQTRSVLAHEFAHLRRRDHWVRCFELIVLALFWWNPIAWLASRRLRQAEEECCDAWVVWALPDSRRSYGEALLRTVEILTESRVPVIAGAQFGEHVFMSRIEMIMKKTTHHRMPWIGLAAILMVGIAVIPFAAVAVSGDEPVVKPEAEQRIIRITTNKRKATFEVRVDPTVQVVLQIGKSNAAKKKLEWTTAWGNGFRKTVTASISLSNKLKLENGKFGPGIVYRVGRGSRYSQVNIAMTEDDPVVPHGIVQFRSTKIVQGQPAIVRRGDAVEFADIKTADGTLIPISLLVRKRPYPLPQRPVKLDIRPNNDGVGNPTRPADGGTDGDAKPSAASGKPQLQKKVAPGETRLLTVEEQEQRTIERVARYKKRTIERVARFKPAWGIARDNLQIGIAITADQRKFHVSERVPLEIYIRNVGKKTIHIKQSFYGPHNPPIVHDARGKRLQIDTIHLSGGIALYRHILKPNEVVLVHHQGLGLGANPRPKKFWHPFAKDPRPGMYRLTQSMSITVTEVDGVNKGSRLNLTTAEVSLEIVGEDKARALLQRKATARIEELGGNLHSSENAVVQISLFKTKATDADLALIPSFDKLVSLALTETQVTDAGLVHIQNMTTLGDIDLANTRVTDDGVALLKKLSAMEYLSLIGTRVTDKGLVHVKELKNLVMLNLTGTNISNDGLVHLNELPKLSTLTLSRTRITDRGLAHLRGIKSMRDIRFCETAVSDAGLEHLKDMSKLKTVLLNTTKISGPGLRHLPISVTSLWLPQTQVDDDGLKHIAHLTRLETLVLSSTRVTDEGLIHLMRLPNLQRISLQGTKVTEAGLERLRLALPKCRVNR